MSASGSGTKTDAERLGEMIHQLVLPTDYRWYAVGGVQQQMGFDVGVRYVGYFSESRDTCVQRLVNLAVDLRQPPLRIRTRLVSNGPPTAFLLVGWLPEFRENFPSENFGDGDAPGASDRDSGKSKND